MDQLRPPARWSSAIDQARWIAERLGSFAEGVTSVVPAGFDAYARITGRRRGTLRLHRATEPASLPWRTARRPGRRLPFGPGTGGRRVLRQRRYHTESCGHGHDQQPLPHHPGDGILRQAHTLWQWHRRVGLDRLVVLRGGGPSAWSAVPWRPPTPTTEAGTRRGTATSTSTTTRPTSGPRQRSCSQRLSQSKVPTRGVLKLVGAPSRDGPPRTVPQGP